MNYVTADAQVIALQSDAKCCKGWRVAGAVVGGNGFANEIAFTRQCRERVKDSVCQTQKVKKFFQVKSTSSKYREDRYLQLIKPQISKLISRRHFQKLQNVLFLAYIITITIFTIIVT